jgi:hypothetical protein
MAEFSYLHLFGNSEQPKYDTAWLAYERGREFNNQINLENTVKANENFYIGKQWEGVQSNGLPTPQVNILKQTVGYITATITSDNIKVNATAMSRMPDVDKLDDPVRIINDEFAFLTEINSVSTLVREFARNAAVDGDGCTYTYWDADVDAGNGDKGAIKTEIIQNTRVFFGNPNNKTVQTQPFIQIAKREPVRSVQKRAKANGISDYERILPDDDDNQAVDTAKRTDDKVTVITTLYRDDKDGEIWAYESTQSCDVMKPKSLGIRLYPITWLCWDYVADSYHGQAMITGLIPNQIFINKALAMAMVSMMRTAWPKTVYDKGRVKKWDNRIGSAIPVAGGDINSVAKVIDPPSISPQVSQFIELAITKTRESLGASDVALGNSRPDNTSAIIALQRAAATPSEQTKQNLYKTIEDLYRIYYEFIAEYYGTRIVSMETPDELKQAFEFAGQPIPPTISAQFDFGFFKENPFLLKLDVGASTYYSEIASMQTLENMLARGNITTIQFLERVSDDYVPKRRALIDELKAQQMQMMQPPLPGQEQPPAVPEIAQPKGMNNVTQNAIPELKGGKGNGALQRKIAATGSTEGLI